MEKFHGSRSKNDTTWLVRIHVCLGSSEEVWVAINCPGCVQDDTHAQTRIRSRTQFVTASKGMPWNATGVAPWLLQRTELGRWGDKKYKDSQIK